MKLRKTRHPLDPHSRELIVEMLNDFLALAIDLRLQVKQAHWNVRGPNFISLHELFDRLSGELDEIIDELAERATALGGRALGTASRVADKSKLDELPKKATAGLKLVALLADRFAAVTECAGLAIAQSQKAGDEVTADLFIKTSGELDKALWFLEATLETDPSCEDDVPATES
ncbi:DNA starvation/stationary phase protection protein Dps [Luteolibacter soli]|uniref:DNA starvation/stationary phase protection protein Dps n=1 Tax=Luteolibacter soli TaxID=3135280 RepID=A0ABU9AZ29_9BACT